MTRRSSILFCTSCGTALAASERFCPQCGRPNAAAAEAGATPASPPSPQIDLKQATAQAKQLAGQAETIAGESPVLVAVDQDGTYYLEGVQLYGAPTVTERYSLSMQAVPADPDGLAKINPSEPIAVWPVLLDRPFRMAGSELVAPDGPVLIHLNYADDTGSDWVLMGTGAIKGGSLTTDSLTIPSVLEFLGRKHPTKVPGTYQLIVTNDQRPFNIYLTQSIAVQNTQ